jgi:hypothetical protein
VKLPVGKLGTFSAALTWSWNGVAAAKILVDEA